MSHNYYSEQCSRCKWGEWRGGCLNPASAEDLSDMDAAYKKGACRVFEAGAPQPDQTPRTLYVQMPKETYDKLIAERDALRKQVAAWQPIATAPTNGARVLLWYAPTRIDKGEAVEGFWDSLFDGQWMTSRGSSYIDGRLRRPTHWMPLPRGPGESA
jgi:hypothetical protein